MPSAALRTIKYHVRHTDLTADIFSRMHLYSVYECGFGIMQLYVRIMLR